MTELATADRVVLSLHDVQVNFPVDHDWLGRHTAVVHALNGLDLELYAGETLGIVGESGCGKSTLAQLLLGLRLPTKGTLRWRALAGQPCNVQIVFQDPQTSLDPRLPIWRIIAEPLYVQRSASREEMLRRAQEVAEQVGIRPEYLHRYPHQFSGGQRQRIAIARALISDPDVIVLDEPTSALDISVQAQILNLLSELQRHRKLTYVLISHNVSVVRHMSDRIAVMYLGQFVELGETCEVLSLPKHPYTRLLLDAVPRLGRPMDADTNAEATDLPGNRRLPTGCFFYDRCPDRTTGCERIQILKESDGRRIRCHMQGLRQPLPAGKND